MPELLTRSSVQNAAAQVAGFISESVAG